MNAKWCTKFANQISIMIMMVTRWWRGVKGGIYCCELVVSFLRLCKNYGTNPLIELVDFPVRNRRDYWMCFTWPKRGPIINITNGTCNGTQSDGMKINLFDVPFLICSIRLLFCCVRAYHKSLIFCFHKLTLLSLLDDWKTLRDYPVQSDL